MDLVSHDDKTFEKVDYSGKKLTAREFTNCEFIQCDFTKSDLSNNDFMDCVFKNCNFSLTVFQDTGLKNIQFIGCKLMGIDFGRVNDFLFSMNFQDCHLDYSSFFQKKMKKTQFNNCSIKDASFDDVDLTMAVFNNCDLLNTSFVRCNLEKADFRSAFNYAFDPEDNKMKKARFSTMGIAGLLMKYGIEVEG